MKLKDFEAVIAIKGTVMERWLFAKLTKDAVSLTVEEKMAVQRKNRLIVALLFLGVFPVAAFIFMPLWGSAIVFSIWLSLQFLLIHRSDKIRVRLAHQVKAAQAAAVNYAMGLSRKYGILLPVTEAPLSVPQTVC